MCKKLNLSISVTHGTNIQNTSMFASVIESRNTGTDHFSVELKNVKKFTLRTMTITKLFKKESGINLTAMIS